MLAGFEAKSPVAYRMLFTDRNARWAQWIARRLQQPGTVFVAVGAGHLAGKDSVQHKLGRTRHPHRAASTDPAVTCLFGAPPL